MATWPSTPSLAGRTRKALDRWHSRARYALVVSIRTPEEMVDIYTGGGGNRHLRLSE